MLESSRYFHWIPKWRLWSACFRWWASHFSSRWEKLGWEEIESTVTFMDVRRECETQFPLMVVVKRRLSSGGVEWWHEFVMNWIFFLLPWVKCGNQLGCKERKETPAFAGHLRSPRAIGVLSGCHIPSSSQLWEGGMGWAILGVACMTLDDLSPCPGTLRAGAHVLPSSTYFFLWAVSQRPAPLNP